MPLDISIVIPAYNEQDRIVPTLKNVLGYADTLDLGLEVIVVSDGSSDRTVAAALDVGDRRVQAIEYERNTGKGYAIKTGVLASKGDLVLFTDADLSTPIQMLERLHGEMTGAGADIAIGSRALQGANITRSQPWYRVAGGKVFNGAVRLLTGLPYHDTQCGFKLYKGPVAKDLFSRLTILRWGFDAEILYAAKVRDYKVVEVPVEWQNDPRSKVNFLKDGMTMVGNLVQTRFNALKGAYD